MDNKNIGLERHPVYDPELRPDSLKIKTPGALARARGHAGTEDEIGMVLRNIIFAESIGDNKLLDQYRQRREELLTKFRERLADAKRSGNSSIEKDLTAKIERLEKLDQVEGVYEGKHFTPEELEEFIKEWFKEQEYLQISTEEIKLLISTLPKKGFHKTNMVAFKNWAVNFKKGTYAFWGLEKKDEYRLELIRTLSKTIYDRNYY